MKSSVIVNSCEFYIIIISDIDECTYHSPCAHICRDLKVGYECDCNPGFRRHTQNPHLCQDIDECTDLEVVKPCSHHCRNTLGSYVCSCAEGYVLRSDNHSCKANSCEYCILTVL